jgi:hypothetical protein
MKLPNLPVFNRLLTAALGSPVVKLDVIPVSPGERLRVTFVAKSGEWRHGIWVGVDGELEIAGRRSDQFEIWTDTSPPSFEIVVVATSDGLLRLYNIWDSQRGLRRESQSATSGMLKEARGTSVIYRANAIGSPADFAGLVFVLDRASGP